MKRGPVGAAAPSAAFAMIAALVGAGQLVADTRTSGSAGALATTGSVDAAACPDDLVGEDGFVDVPTSSVHEAAVDCLAWWGVASGAADGTYGPGQAISREAMASLVARLVDAVATLPDAADGFADDDGSLHEPNIDRLAAAGIVTGEGDGRFDPRGPVSRAQMASYLARVYAYASGGPLEAGPDAFSDDDGSVHEDAIDRLAAAGIVTGVGPGRFAPTSPVTREAMASFLVRLLERLVADGLAAVPYDPDAPVVSGRLRVVADPVSSGPAVYGADDLDHAAPAVDEAAVDAFAADVAGWLDRHLSELARGGPGAFDEASGGRALVDLDRPSLLAATTDLVSLDRRIRAATYDVFVAVDGAPRWALVVVTTAGSDGTVAKADFVFLPDQAGPVLVAAGPAVGSEGSR